LRVVDAAQRHVTRLQVLAPGASLPASALNDADRRAFLLVAKTFKLHERQPRDAAAAVARVDSILRQSMVLVSQRVHRPPIVSPAPTATSPLFVCLFGHPAHIPPALGYTVAGGLHLGPGPSGSFNPFIVPGQVLPERDSRIYLTPSFDGLNSDLQRLTMIHELAHNVGGKAGSAGEVQELAVVDNQAKYKGLNSFQRLHTADSFAFFATECAIGTMTAIINALTTIDTIGEWPKVTTSFLAPEPVIELPPASNVAAAKFAFPAGFT
jgi:hypothetical protein